MDLTVIKKPHSSPHGEDSSFECFERTGRLTKSSQAKYSQYRVRKNPDILLNQRQCLAREVLLILTRFAEKVFCKELNLRLHLELRAIGLNFSFEVKSS